MKELILLFMAFYAICGFVWAIVVSIICARDKSCFSYPMEEVVLLSLFEGTRWPYSIYKCMKL